MNRPRLRDPLAQTMRSIPGIVLQEQPAGDIAAEEEQLNFTAGPVPSDQLFIMIAVIGVVASNRNIKRIAER